MFSEVFYGLRFEEVRQLVICSLFVKLVFFLIVGYGVIWDYIGIIEQIKIRRFIEVLICKDLESICFGRCGLVFFCFVVVWIRKVIIFVFRQVSLYYYIFVVQTDELFFVRNFQRVLYFFDFKIIFDVLRQSQIWLIQQYNLKLYFFIFVF